MRKIVLAVIAATALSSAHAADVVIPLSDAEQQGLFSNDGAFDGCLKNGGQRCVLIQDFLKSKIVKAQQPAPPAPEPAKPEKKE